ncbi:hypothetical protein L6258_00130 [Candidatus Parcubacteria bacterium]|nr:hypothetical protein [Candidatus Parcubacteria bacterium]
MTQATAPQEAPEKVPDINFAAPATPAKQLAGLRGGRAVPNEELTPKTTEPPTPPLLEKPKARWPKYLLFGILGLIIGAALGALALKFL